MEGGPRAHPPLFGDRARNPRRTRRPNMKREADKIIERHHAPDIFCDSALAISFRHNLCRITLRSDRLDPVDGETVNRFVDLSNQMTAAIQRLTKAGRVRAVERTPPS